MVEIQALEANEKAWFLKKITVVNLLGDWENSMASKMR